MTPVTLTLQVTEENAKVVAKFLLDLFPESSAPAEELKPDVKSKPAPSKLKPEAPPPAEVKPEEPKPSEKKVSLSDVRAKALLLSKAGKQETLKALFAKHGGSKLSEIEPAKFEALLADMEAEING